MQCRLDVGIHRTHSCFYLVLTIPTSQSHLTCIRVFLPHRHVFQWLEEFLEPRFMTKTQAQQPNPKTMTRLVLHVKISISWMFLLGFVISWLEFWHVKQKKPNRKEGASCLLYLFMPPLPYFLFCNFIC